MGDAAPTAFNGTRCTVQKGKHAGKDATILRSSGSYCEYHFQIQFDGESSDSKARFIKPTHVQLHGDALSAEAHPKRDAVPKQGSSPITTALPLASSAAVTPDADTAAPATAAGGVTAVAVEAFTTHANTMPIFKVDGDLQDENAAAATGLENAAAATCGRNGSRHGHPKMLLLLKRCL